MRNSSTASQGRWITLAGFSLLAISLARTAWLSDDSYISFRTASNLLEGFGPVWNVGERVQAFTHPLWLAVCTAAFGITGEVYFTAIAASVAVTVATVALLIYRIGSSTASTLFIFAALLSSKAFIDYSTSGLENPLSHLLLVLFVWQWWSPQEERRRLLRLSLIGALCIVNRMDLVFMVAPALAYLSWRLGPRAAARPLLLGMLPLIAWLAFATFYYGTPLPNTAYAKIFSPSVPLSSRMQRGFSYFGRSLIQDPVTVVVMGASLLWAAWHRRVADLVIGAGLLLYLLYIVRIGGDFMMGRFFSAPLVVAVALLAHGSWMTVGRRGLLVSTAVAALGLLSPWEPALLSGFGYAYVRNVFDPASTNPLDEVPYLEVRQIVDERRWYYENLGMLKVISHGGVDHKWRTEGLELRAKAPVVVARGGIGLSGFYAGPRVHIIDVDGLADPLLARIPAGSAATKIGHYIRVVPEGYEETQATGRNRIRDPNLAAYYDGLHTVVAGDLWSWARLRTASAFLAGRYDHHLQRYLEKTR